MIKTEGHILKDYITCLFNLVVILSNFRLLAFLKCSGLHIKQLFFLITAYVLSKYCIHFQNIDDLELGECCRAVKRMAIGRPPAALMSVGGDKVNISFYKIATPC